MSRYASWTRVEPDARAVDPRAGAETPVADPFWLLSRQWWIGELEGHDGGAPVAAEVHLAVASVGELDRDARHAVLSGELGAPIALEADRHTAHWRTAYRLGIDALAHLTGALGQAAEDDDAGNVQREAELHRDIVWLAEAFPLTVPALLEHRIPPTQRLDGVALLLAYRRTDERLVSLAPHLFAWADGHSHVRAGADTFSVETGRHTASLPSGTGVARAAGARGPDLHWSDVTVDPGDLFVTETQDPVPVRLSFDGAPAERWWGVEDPRLAFVSASAGPSDLGRLVMVAMLQEQGGVAWALPVDVPAGSVARVTGVSLSDGFGKVRHSTSFEDEALLGWKVGNHDPSTATPQWLLLLNEPQPLRGAALEEVTLIVDEADHVVWMIEDVATDEWGRGHHLTQAAPRPTPDRAEYTPRLSPPDAWLAYQQTDRGHLVRAVLAPQGERGQPHTRFAQDRLDLTPATLGGGGRRLRRQWTLARSSSGRRLLWESRRSLPGSSRGGSGLLHDQIVRPEPGSTQP